VHVEPSHLFTGVMRLEVSFPLITLTARKTEPILPLRASSVRYLENDLCNDSIKKSYSSFTPKSTTSTKLQFTPYGRPFSFLSLSDSKNVSCCSQCRSHAAHTELELNTPQPHSATQFNTKIYTFVPPLLYTDTVHWSWAWASKPTQMQLLPNVRSGIIISKSSQILSRNSMKSQSNNSM